MSVAQLAKENKKFQYKLAKKGGTAKIFGEAINWLILSGTVLKCKLVSHGNIPLTAYEDDSDFKIYLSDVGLLGAKAQMPIPMLLNAVVKAISMNTFVQEYKSPIAYRISSKNFGLGNGIKSIPLYAAFCIEME